jgi:hypothetical protein
VAAVLLVAASLFAGPAEGRPRSFRYYPQDLDMEVPGKIEADLRIGWALGQADPYVVAPDLQFDVGLTRRLEIGLDMQAGLPSPGSSWTSTDSAWLSAKHLLVDQRGSRRAFALGLQHGLRIGIGSGSSGLGYQGVILGSLRFPETMLVVSCGAFLDPPSGAPSVRPLGGFAALDFNQSLPGEWTAEAQVVGAHAAQDGGSTAVALGAAWAGANYALRSGFTASVARAGYSAGVYLGVAGRFSGR